MELDNSAQAESYRFERQAEGDGGQVCLEARVVGSLIRREARERGKGKRKRD